MSSSIPPPMPDEAINLPIASLVFVSMTLVFLAYTVFRTYMKKDDDERQNGSQTIDNLYIHHSSQLETHIMTGLLF